MPLRRKDLKSIKRLGAAVMMRPAKPACRSGVPGIGNYGRAPGASVGFVSAMQANWRVAVRSRNCEPGFQV